MAVTTEQLSEFIQANATDAALVASCLAEALALVTRVNKVYNVDSETYVASAAPQVIVDRAVLAVGAELFNQRNTRNGVAQFMALDEQPIRVARDPMVGAYPLLSPWVVFGL